MSCSFQKWSFVCGQKWTESKDWAMEQDNGFGFWIRRVAEVKDIAIWA